MNQGSVRKRLIIGLAAVAVIAAACSQHRQLRRPQRGRVAARPSATSRSASRTRAQSATAGARR